MTNVIDQSGGVGKVGRKTYKTILKAKEIIQAGDCFLLKVTCPVCLRNTVCGVDQSACSHCSHCFDDYVFSVGRRRLLAGTKRLRSGVLSKRFAHMLREAQQNQCAYCYNDLAVYHFDHIIPLSFGGTNDIRNLVLACPKCNLIGQDLVFSSLDAKRNYIVQRRWELDRMQPSLTQ
jgi:hypothetical protein